MKQRCLLMLKPMKRCMTTTVLGIESSCDDTAVGWLVQKNQFFFLIFEKKSIFEMNEGIVLVLDHKVYLTKKIS